MCVLFVSPWLQYLKRQFEAGRIILAHGLSVPYDREGVAQFIAVETHGGVVQSRKQGPQTGTRADRTFKSLLSQPSPTF